MEQKFCQSCGMPLTGQPMEQREQSDACIDSAESRQRKTEGQVLGTNGRSSESHPSSLEVSWLWCRREAKGKNVIKWCAAQSYGAYMSHRLQMIDYHSSLFQTEYPRFLLLFANIRNFAASNK